MTRNNKWYGAAIFIAMLMPTASAAASADRLPETLGAPHERAGDQRWDVAETVEVTRITGVAVQGATRLTAFILKQPSIAIDDDRYGLYVMDASRQAPARKLLESSFLADLEWRPGTTNWTFRGDFGAGVQLYELDSSGRLQPLVVNADVARVGGSDGLVHSPIERPRQVGVLSYGWSPDGSVLWYSRLKLRSPAEVRAWRDDGVLWQDSKMSPADLYAEPAALAVELHILEPRSASDRIAVSAPGDRMAAMCAFSKDCGSVGWIDAHNLWYRSIVIAGGGQRTPSLWSYDLDKGRPEKAETGGFMEAFGSATTPDGLLVVQRGKDGHNRLVEKTRDGKPIRNYGEVGYSAIGGHLGAWHDVDGKRSLYGVRGRDRNGLTLFPRTAGSEALERIGDHLGACAFNQDLSFGACSRESLTDAPELVAVLPETGAVTVLARPNSRYDRIEPLHSVPAQWTNRFGGKDDGYITYPRDYQPGRRYPAMVVTHGTDARNRFVYDGFQWSYPVQIWAERGYFVLSVNERTVDLEALAAYAAGTASLPVARMQKAMGFEAIATMEAAAQSVIDQGLVDPDRIGIAGYSRGGIVTTLVLSHSRMFKVGANADTNFFSAGGYWMGAMVRALYKGLFGGSPFDPDAYPNYLAFSPSARASHFSGPLLQLHTATVAPSGLELHEVLKDAGVPTELVFYPDETHVLHRPRTRAAAMQLNLDWFDYWLRGRRDPDNEKVAQYQRWDAMALRWKGVDAQKSK